MRNITIRIIGNSFQDSHSSSQLSTAKCTFTGDSFQNYDAKIVIFYERKMLYTKNYQYNVNLQSKPRPAEMQAGDLGIYKNCKSISLFLPNHPYQGYDSLWPLRYAWTVPVQSPQGRRWCGLP